MRIELVLQHLPLTQDTHTGSGLLSADKGPFLGVGEVAGGRGEVDGGRRQELGVPETAESEDRSGGAGTLPALDAFHHFLINQLRKVAVENRRL